MYYWLNGKYYLTKSLKISVFDRGLLYGDGLFETFPVINEVPLFLDSHLSRLYKSLRLLKIPISYSKDDLSSIVNQFIKKNKLKKSAIRLIITRGRNQGGFAVPRNAIPTVIITTRPIPKLERIPGSKLIISSIRQNEFSSLSGLKTCNGLPYILALTEAHQKKADEAILLNTKNQIAECSMHTIFWFHKNILYTPSIDCGVLPGITRKIIIQLAKKMNIKVIESFFPIGSLYNADEVFITNSLRGIQPVVQIQKKQIHRGIPGSMTMHMKSVYNKYIQTICETRDR